MKIDYELVEKIGATHYCETTYRLYKVSAMTLLVYIDDNWRLCLAGSAALAHIKPIPPKPQVRIEYEKVTDSIFDLKYDLERGELYTPTRGAGGDSYRKINDEQEFIMFATCGIYRRIEKPVDWRDEVAGFLNKGLTCHDADSPWFDLSNEFRFGGKLNKRDFLEMCRIALRANGEL